MKLDQAKCVFALLLSVCSTVALAEKQYKSPEEFNLYTAVTKDFAGNDMAKVLAGLDAWKQKFPESDFTANRQLLYVQAYARAGQQAKAIEAAKPVIGGPFDSPDDQLRLIYTLVTASQQVASLDGGQRETAMQAAKQLAAFDKMPAGMKPEDWQKARGDLRTAASVTIVHLSLMPIREAVKASDCAAAETAGTAVVREHPDSVQAAWVLASAQLCLARKTPDKFAPALYSLARAAALDPVKGLVDPAWQKGTAAPYLDKIYAQYHGPDPEGLKQLKASALAAPLPPEGFTISSLAQIEQSKQADFESKNPELALWLRIKPALAAANGETYFASELKDAAVPPLAGTLVGAKPACRPTELSIVLSKGESVAEVALKLSKPLTGKPELNTELRFEGVPSAFKREPFLLTMDSDPGKVSGLKTAPCGPTPARKK